MRGRLALSAALVLAALSSSSQSGKFRDTAGYRLDDVWKGVRSKFPDALLLSINGQTVGEGTVICDTKYPMADGWRYHFYSPSRSTYLLMSRCGDSIVGPVKEIRSTDKDVDRPKIDGDFIDSPEVFSALARARISVNPDDHGGRGKRPFTLTLMCTRDPAYKAQPAFWMVKVGTDQYIVNAKAGKIALGAIKDPILGGGSNAKDLGVLREEQGSGPENAGKRPIAGRPHRDGLYTAKTDVKKVLALVQRKMPGSTLMGIESIADAYGSVRCVGVGDGWTYYLYNPRRRSVETAYACNGKVGMGKASQIPIDLAFHQPISGDFIDSDQAMNLMLEGEPGSMNEGMGRKYTRKGAMRLMNYKVSPFQQAELMKVTLIWEAEVGSTIYYIDAFKGSYIGSKDKQ
ncbi:MAG: hypothetical protein HY078_12915 [Elusimicrobia bacterium]|nr:hypothetical protein [Elusimicrobiota bacterium]